MAKRDTREEQTGSYDIDPAISERIRANLGLEVRVSSDLAKIALDVLDRYLPLEIRDEVKAREQLVGFFSELRTTEYPLPNLDYTGMGFNDLYYAHFIGLRAKIRADAQSS